MNNAFKLYKSRVHIVWMLLVLLPAYAVAKEIVVVATEDTIVTEHSQAGGPGSNHGGDIVLQAIGMPTFRSIPLIRFDLSEFAGSKVAGDAKFSVYVRAIHPQQQAIQKIFSIYTWKSLDWDQNSVTFDQAGFAINSDSMPADLALPKLDTVQVDSSDNQKYISFTIPQAIVQGWIDDAGSNRGLVLVNEQTEVGHDVVFNARESGPGTEPTLTFTIN
jgi:hypothetical protein